MTRYRRKLIQNLATEHKRLIRIFEDANLKLSSVFSDVTGKACTAVIDHVIDGNTAPEFLASLCTHWRLKSTMIEIALAVEGHFREHHKFMLRAIRRSMENLTEEIRALDEEITRRMQPFEEEITRLCCQIPGISRTSAKDLLAETGVSMEVFLSSAHLASWAGVSPGNNESAGKKNSHTNHDNKQTKAVITECVGGKLYQEHIFLTTL